MAEEQGPGWGGVPARLDCIWGGGGDIHMVTMVGVWGERVEVRVLGGVVPVRPERGCPLWLWL